MNLVDYLACDATDLAERIRSGETTPAELESLARERAAAVNPKINAIIELWDEADSDHGSDAPFAGVPFLIKDLVLHTDHADCEMGSRLAEGVRFPHDTDLMRRFRAAGLHTLGRTTSPEMGYSPTTECILHGPTRNPWDLSRSSGGSSGGSAAAVAAGIVPVAHANDGGGSIRIPAACSGLVGVKPTRGRTPTGPDSHDPLCGLGIEFAVTRSVRDAAALLDAVQGAGSGDGYVIPSPALPYADVCNAPARKLRIAWTDKSYNGKSIAPEVRDALHQTVQLLADFGHDMVETTPVFSYDAFMDATHIIWSAFVAHSVQGVSGLTGRAPSLDTLEATTLACFEEGLRWSAQDLMHAMDNNNLVCRQVAGFFAGIDVLLTPVLAELPLPIGEMNANDPSLSARDWTEKVFGYAAFTGLFNTTGQPAFSLPLQRTAAQLPIGMQFVGQWGDEATLFNLAAELERALPWPRVAEL